MKRLNVLKEYEYLFDGSKLFCDFTDIEKKIYINVLTTYRIRRNKMSTAITLSITILTIIISAASIYLSLTK